MKNSLKIGMCSTVSCGKTTLVKALAELPQFKNFHIATERSKYLRDLGIPLNSMSTAYGQHIFAGERLAELQHSFMITDRTLIDVLSFTSLSPIIDEYDKNRFEVYISPFLKQYDYIFYISPEGIEIEDNGVRETDPEFRTAIDNKIKQYLEHYKFRIKNLHTISGTTEERIKQVLDIIEF